MANLVRQMGCLQPARLLLLFKLSPSGIASVTLTLLSLVAC